MTSPGDDDPTDPSEVLRGAHYDERALDLVRFLDDPADDAISRLAHDAERLSSPERDLLRSRIDEAGAYTLLTYARRRAASALRTQSLDQAVEANRALTLVPRARIDYRDLNVDFALFAVHQLGGDVDEVIRRAVASSDANTAAAFTASAPSGRTLTLERCGLVGVRSSYGLGFMPGWSRRSAPTTDLALVAVRLADAIDDDGRYVVDDIHGSDLPGVWFSGERPPPRVATTGCVSVSARLRGTSRWSHGLLVFVAQLPRRRVAAELVRRASEASTSERPRTAIAVGRRLAVIVGGSGTSGEDAVETAASLLTFGHLATRALSD